MFNTKNQDLRTKIAQIKNTALNGSVFDLLSMSQIDKLGKLDKNNGIKFILGEIIYSSSDAGFNVTELHEKDPTLSSFLLESAIEIYDAIVPFLEEINN